MGRLAQILDRLREVIPAPAPKPVKKQDSFAGLKPEMWLSDDEGSLWQIIKVDSEGAMAQCGKGLVRINKRWPEHYKKAGREAKKLKLKGYL